MEKCQYHDALDSKIDTISNDVKKIMCALLGTFDKKGVVTKVEEHDLYISKQRETKSGWCDWAFRCFLTLVISFIAIKVGLK